MMTAENEFISGDEAIIEHFHTHAFYLDHHLKPAEQTHAESLQFLIENTLYNCLQYYWWLDEKNQQVISKLYTRNTGFMRFWEIHQKRRDVQTMLELQYETSGDNLKKVVFQRASKCFDILSSALGDKQYLLGDTPSTIDAIAYAHLACVLFIDLPTPELQSILAKHKNLVSYCNTILQKFFLDDPPSTFHPGPSKQTYSSSSTSADSREEGAYTSPPKPETPEQVERKRRNWIFVASGLAAMLLYTGYEHYLFQKNM